MGTFQVVSSPLILYFSILQMEGSLLPPSLYAIKGILILDNDGNRILSSYYDKVNFPTLKEQTAFEKNLFNKTSKSNAEIVLLDGMVILHRSNVDLYFYVIGSQSENELLLLSALNCVYDSVSQILRKNVEKRALFENLDIVLLAMDEICDGGIFLEADPNAVVSRVAIRTDDIPIGEQTVAQVQARIGAKMAATSAVLQSAKDQLNWSLLK